MAITPINVCYSIPGFLRGLVGKGSIPVADAANDIVHPAKTAVDRFTNDQALSTYAERRGLKPIKFPWDTAIENWLSTPVAQGTGKTEETPKKEEPPKKVDTGA